MFKCLPGDASPYLINKVSTMHVGGSPAFIEPSASYDGSNHQVELKLQGNPKNVVLIVPHVEATHNNFRLRETNKNICRINAALTHPEFICLKRTSTTTLCRPQKGECPPTLPPRSATEATQKVAACETHPNKNVCDKPTQGSGENLEMEFFDPFIDTCLLPIEELLFKQLSDEHAKCMRALERTKSCYQDLLYDCQSNQVAVDIIKTHQARYYVYFSPCAGRYPRKLDTLLDCFWINFDRTQTCSEAFDTRFFTYVKQTQYQTACRVSVPKLPPPIPLIINTNKSLLASACIVLRKEIIRVDQSQFSSYVV
ncbi:hypothetical protein HELRODRAFT_158900 [Helobdella robusta]|uniref:Uncharacterized protein n=1 Tax=Helobdella robusta TaxID=6412 RepID=T1END9_HELRO|nr:hypothetical protein HELRODRAFT_158900 [Helobdella robusta]ESO12386.1 hypothetical protein HELRODRAFT_158900 [Helobdella robusta]